MTLYASILTYISYFFFFHNKHRATYFLLLTYYFANYTDYLIDKLPHAGKSNRFDSVTLTNALAPPLETMQEIRLNAHQSDYRTELASTHGKRLSTFIIYATRCRGHYERSFSPTSRSSLAKLRFNDAL